MKPPTIAPTSFADTGAALHRFATHDGVELAYRHWPATSSRPRGHLLLFHRGHEHSGRMAHLPGELGLTDFEVFAWDARGHGLSPGARGASPSFGTSVRDIQTFVEHLTARHGLRIEDTFVVAQSVGAVLVATWVHDYAPPIRGMALAAPAFKVKLYVPFARTGIRLLRALRGNFFVNSYVKPQLLTHDAGCIAGYRADPLISRPISATMLLGLYEAAERVVADAAAIAVPTLVLVSGSDWVVHERPQRQFFERLSSPVKAWHRFEGFHHDTLGERDRHLALAPLRAFIEKLFAAPPPPVDVRDADRRGATFDEPSMPTT